MTSRNPPSPHRRATLKAMAAATLGLPPLAGAQTTPAKVLRYAFPIAETGMDPVALSDLYSRILTAHIFENFYDYDHLARPFKIRPCTAAGMPEVSEDFRTYTVRIKPGIYFQDDPVFKGSKRELVAQDYVYSWKRFFDPRWKAPAFATLNELKMLGMGALRDAALKDKKPFDYDTEVEGMRALDRYTVRFRFAEPQPRFIQTMAGGDLSVTVPVGLEDEIGQLGRSFNSMAERLRDAFSQVELEKNRIEILLNDLSEGVLGISADGRVTITNPAAAELLGRDLPIGAELGRAFPYDIANV